MPRSPPLSVPTSSGPDWLRSRRTAAAERFAAASLPSTDEEVWRYSRIAELDIDRFALAGPLGGSVPHGLGPAIGDPSAIFFDAAGDPQMDDTRLDPIALVP